MDRPVPAIVEAVEGEDIMKTSDNSKFESYKQEVQDRWGGTAAYKEHAEKTKNYSKDQWDQLAQSMVRFLPNLLCA